MRERSRLRSRTVSTERKQIGRKCCESEPRAGWRAGDGRGGLASSRGFAGRRGLLEARADSRCGSGTHLKAGPAGRGCVDAPQVGRREPPPGPRGLCSLERFLQLVGFGAGGECERELGPWLRRSPRLPLLAGETSFGCHHRFLHPRVRVGWGKGMYARQGPGLGDTCACG